jgi:crooked neck
LESILQDLERARAIYELAIEQPLLDMPEIVWKSYIDFEIEQQDFAKVRGLYKRLLEKTQHVKVWLSFAQFEINLVNQQEQQQSGGEGDKTDNENNNNNNNNNEEKRYENVRGVYKKAFDELKNAPNKESRVLILDAWKEFENTLDKKVSKYDYVAGLAPKEIMKRRKLTNEDGSDAGWEEYVDFVFQDDEGAQPSLKLLALAKKWKQSS